MKTHILSFAVLFSMIAGVFAEETAKPLVSMTVKRHILGSDKDDRGPRSESRDKEMTLRVEIKNLSDTTLEGAELTGDVLLNRAINDNERIVKEALKSMKLPPMKPNEKLTVELGKFTLTELKWKSRTFEETLEEWKVVCKKGEANIGESVSDENYDALVKEMKDQKEEDKKAAEEAKKDDKDRPETLIRKKQLRKKRD